LLALMITTDRTMELNPSKILATFITRVSLKRIRKRDKKLVFLDSFDFSRKGKSKENAFDDEDDD